MEVSPPYFFKTVFKIYVTKLKPNCIAKAELPKRQISFLLILSYFYLK